ncbi:MAG: hypothetical protein H0T46_18990 [Deltaproteobacteria bacterium]|nr:hypothetical protein [Deltaproteobacteria bacterium]
MRTATLTILGIAACGLGQTRWQAKPEQLAPMPVLSPKVSSSVGPLALEPGAGETSWPDVGTSRKITDFHYLDRPRIHGETTTFLGFVDTFYAPLTPETKIGFMQAHQSLSTLENLAPYSIWSVTLAFQQSTQRLNLCIMNAGVTGPCFRDLKPRAPRPAPFEIGEVSPEIGLLAVHDLRDASAWGGFAEAAQALANKRGLVIDLRDAIGADPRARASRGPRRGLGRARLVRRARRSAGRWIGARRLRCLARRTRRDPSRLHDTVSGVARHPVRVNRPLGPRRFVRRVADAHTRFCRGGSAKRWHGRVFNPE